jgi:hypothetical protein
LAASPALQRQRRTLANDGGAGSVAATGEHLNVFVTVATLSSANSPWLHRRPHTDE